MVVSGLARGIDTAAHSAALETGTAAILGGGVDHIYPRENTELYESIRSNGAIVSESPLGYRASAKDFPRRNRIISGLSRAVIVIEAAERSGTLITARYALEQNREVMAAPGSPLDPRTKGCNRLIRQGAHLIENARDIIEVLESLSGLEFHEPENKFLGPEPKDNLSEKDIQDAESAILSLLSPTPTHRDEIIRVSNLPAPLIHAVLTLLEINGEIDVEVDGRISKGF